MDGMEAILLNIGQRIAKEKELAEDKIAIQATQNKQVFASSRQQEKLTEPPNQDQEKR